MANVINLAGEARDFEGRVSKRDDASEEKDE